MTGLNLIINHCIRKTLIVNIIGELLFRMLFYSLFILPIIRHYLYILLYYVVLIILPNYVVLIILPY